MAFLQGSGLARREGADVRENPALKPFIKNKCQTHHAPPPHTQAHADGINRLSFGTQEDVVTMRMGHHVDYTPARGAPPHPALHTGAIPMKLGSGTHAPCVMPAMPKPSVNLSDRGYVWVVTQSLLLLAVILLGILQPGDWTRAGIIVTGAGLFLVGGVFGIAGVLVLGRNRTPFPRPRENSELVQHGIYARVRHPLYTSVMLSSFGWALIWQSTAAAVAALVLVPLLLAKARHEEQWLRAKFTGYAEYARRVPAFLPRLLCKRHFVCCC